MMKKNKDSSAVNHIWPRRIALLTGGLISLLSVLGVYFSVVYASPSAEVTKDASELCRIYAPENWQHSQHAGQHEILTMIMQETASRLQTDEMKQAVDGSAENSFSEYHGAVVERVSQLIGKAWTCDHFNNFFHPQINLRSVHSGEASKHRIDTSDASVVYVEILDEETITFNRSPLKEFSRSILEKAFAYKLSDIDAKSEKVILAFDTKVDYARVELVLDVLAQMGIRNVYLVE